MNFEISIEKVKNSRIAEFDTENIGFGKIFADHMFLSDWDGEAWINHRIVPYGPFSLSPATSAIHYGQSIFEGMKAFASIQNSHDVILFRPEENAKRFNRSARRMAMPEIPQELFIKSLTTLIDIDRNWVPRTEGGSLYIRPFMFATDDFIGVKPSNKYTYAVFCCPVGPYYSKPLRVKVEEEFSRAAPGGVGFTKCAGNYAASLLPTALAQDEGYDQVLWTDSITHTLVEETGTTNFFAVYGNTIVTPELTDTLLAGTTRESVILSLRALGYNVEERKLSVQELKDKLSAGLLSELFITGTAATLINLDGFGHNGDYHSVIAQGNQDVSVKVKTYLDNIKMEIAPDTNGWILKF
jgi:branched-chain amino acid aminotransferase